VKFTASPLAGVHTVDLERIEDERGFFARSFCTREFALHGLEAPMSQCSVSFNARRGTLRGLHFQAAPHDEEKLVRCTTGAIFDVAVDLRRGSPTYLKWSSLELDASGNRAFWVPAGFAHGFMALEDADVAYKVTGYWSAGVDGGLRWDDPTIHVRWPQTGGAPVLSAKDAALPALADCGADFVWKP